jgi:hypothetical protein
VPLTFVALIALAPVVDQGPASVGARSVLAALAALTLLALGARDRSDARLGLALTATLAAFALPWQIAWWPLPGAVGVAVYLLAGRLEHSLPRPAVIWPMGRLTRGGLAAIGAIALAATASLLIFRQVTPPGLQFGARLLPHWSLLAGGLAYAAGNAAVEELLYRGVIQRHLTLAVGSWPAVALQAGAYGLLHLHGYPYGAAGVALTTGYGLLLGTLRLKTGGLLAPWITHTLADGVIFLFIVQAAAG